MTISKTNSKCSKQFKEYKIKKESFDNISPNENLERPLSGRSDSPITSSPPLVFNIPPTTPVPSELDKNIKAMGDKFNQLIAEYSNTYKAMSNELLYNNKLPQLKYGDKNIEYNSEYYYVNEYGFASQYGETEWQNRSSSCAKTPVSINEQDFVGLLNGEPMGTGQPCGIAGRNIYNSSSGDHSWVDIRGVAHPYSDGVWKHRSQSCNMSPLPLSDDEYKNLSVGDSMTSSSFCERLNVNPQILQKLANLNKQILDLGNKLLIETQKLYTTDEKLAQEITEAQNKIVSKIKQIGQIEKIPIATQSGTVKIPQPTIDRNIEATTRSSNIFARMNHFKYMIGLILVIILLIFTFATFSSQNMGPFSMIIVTLVLIYGLYNLFIFIKNHFSVNFNST